MDLSCPAPSGGSGIANNPLPDAVAYAEPGNSSDLDAVTSLSPKDMALCQIVPFFIEITVDGSTAPENGVIHFRPDFLSKTTSGGDFGFDPDIGIYCAFVDQGEVNHNDPGGDAKVDSYSDVTLDPNGSNERIHGTIQVSGLDDGDVVFVEIWVVLDCYIGPGITGNVQTNFIGAFTGPVGGVLDNISLGNQTVPLLKVKDFFSSDVDLSVYKSDSQDPIAIGSDFWYIIEVFNDWPSIANSIEVIDHLDDAFGVDVNAITFSTDGINYADDPNWGHTFDGGTGTLLWLNKAKFSF